MEAHPDHKIEYTARLDIASMNNTPRFILTRGYGIGKGTHIVKGGASAKMGAIINIVIEDIRGHNASLVKSFTALAIG